MSLHPYITFDLTTSNTYSDHYTPPRPSPNHNCTFTQETKPNQTKLKTDRTLCSVSYLSSNPTKAPSFLENPNLLLFLYIIQEIHLFLQQTYPLIFSLTLQDQVFHILQPKKLKSLMASDLMQTTQANFEDMLPAMADKLGGEGLIGELCNGFNLLMDPSKGVITFESLKRNAGLLGLQDFSDEDLRSMLKEGDFDGDDALNQMEFCVLMFRLSPELMEESRMWVDDVLQQEFEGC